MDPASLCAGITTLTACSRVTRTYLARAALRSKVISPRTLKSARRLFQRYAESTPDNPIFAR